MINSIIDKEWIKLKNYIYTAFLIIVTALGYFWFNLDFIFSTHEPESMVWYKFAYLDDKPYYSFIYLFLLIAAAVSLAQFLPERIANRIKIITHLPLDMKNVIFLHLLIGSGFVLMLCIVLAAAISFIVYLYYPSIILSIVLKDMAAYSFGSIIVYMGLSAVIIEKNRYISLLKLFFTLAFLFAFFKDEYKGIDIIWIYILAFIPFMVFDSLYSIKQQRLQNPIFKIGIVAAVLLIGVNSFSNYKQNYEKEFNHYYIFYSNILKDFVYQKNFGDHRFEYGVKDKTTFDQKTYESYLPFVYWRNLDIQGKLPVVIEGNSYKKSVIKSSRLGFSYNPKYLKPLELKLYPLFNPRSNKGMITFPEEMFSISSKVKVFDYDHGLLRTMSEDIRKMLDERGFKYPALNIWGKATNMKPYDLGYIIKDSEHKLYNLKRYDNNLFVKEIEHPKGTQIVYIKLSENRQKILSGYAIDEKGDFYLLDWDFGFIKLELKGFDYKTMKLKLISNPVNYLIRYDDGKNYYAVVFDKKFKKIQEITF